jgi:hypothetical protein
MRGALMSLSDSSFGTEEAKSAGKVQPKDPVPISSSPPRDNLTKVAKPDEEVCRDESDGVFVEKCMLEARHATEGGERIIERTVSEIYKL